MKSKLFASFVRVDISLFVLCFSQKWEEIAGQRFGLFYGLHLKRKKKPLKIKI